MLTSGTDVVGVAGSAVAAFVSAAAVNGTAVSAINMRCQQSGDKRGFKSFGIQARMSAEWRQKEFQKPWNPKMSAEWRQKELWKPNIPKRCSKESLAAQCSPLPPVAGTIRLALSQAGEIDADFANFVEEKPEDTHTGLLWCPKCPWNESFHASDRWEWKQGHGKPYQVWIQKMVSKDKCIKGAMGMFDHKKVVCSHHLEGKCVKAAADKCKFEHPSKQKVVKALAELIRRGRQGEDLPSSAASERST